MKAPNILQPGRLKKINEYIYGKTECFAFLLSDVQWAYSEPQSGQEAFEKWSIELYTIYHDYGCGYLSYILSDENILDSDLRVKLRKSKKHVENVIKVFRNNFAHGIFDVHSRKKMEDIVASYYIRDGKNKNGKTYFDTFTDEDWCRAAECLKEESDDLVNNLYAWADEKERSAQMLNVRECFGKSYQFKSSISKRIVFDSLDKEFSRNGRTALEILDQRIQGNKLQKNSDRKLKEWQDSIQKRFLDGTLRTSQDIISELNRLLYAVHHPMEESSIAIASRYGFSLEGF